MAEYQDFLNLFVALFVAGVALGFVTTFGRVR